MGGPRSEAEAWRSLAAMAGHWALRGYGFFSICLRGETEACGLTGAHRPGHYPEVEIGWSLWSEQVEGKSIAHEATLAARDWARGRLPGTSFVSYIDPDNARSIALATRLGAQHDTNATHPFGDEPCHVYRHPQVQT